MCYAVSGMVASGGWKVNPADDWNAEVRVWDPAPSMNLTFNWSGETNARHEAEGEGSLTWYLPGDDYEMLSTYSGTMVSGKREGHGVWLHKSGSKYEGGWRNNVKEGRGEYSLSDGNYYKTITRASSKTT